MKVFTITTLNHNPGDDFIREGLYHLMGGFLKNAEILNIHKHEAPRYFKENPRVLDGIDLVLQAGTPCYWYLNNRQNSSTSEWAFIWKDYLFENEVPPALNVGAGTYFPYHADPFDSFDGEWKDYIVRMTRRCSLTTVRDPIADAFLKKAGFKSQHLIACPALWVSDGFSIQPNKDPKLVAVSYQPLAGHFSLNQDLDVDGYRRGVKKILEGLSKQGFKVQLISHSSQENQETVKAFPEYAHLSLSDPRDLARFYSQCSLFVGSRVHGAYAVASTGSPFILLNSDTRATMADVLGMPRYFMNDVIDRVDEILDLAQKLATPSSEEIWNQKKKEQDRYHQLFEELFSNAF